MDALTEKMYICSSKQTRQIFATDICINYTKIYRSWVMQGNKLSHHQTCLRLKLLTRQRSCNLLQDLFEVQQVWDNSRRFYRNWVLAFSPRGPCMVPCALDTWGGSANQRNQPNLDEQLDFKEAKTSKYCHNFSLLVVNISSTTIEYLSKLETSCSTKSSCKYQSSYQWVVHDYP